MEGAWPALIDALVDAPAKQRTGLLIKALVGINGLWIGVLAVYALGRWLVLGDPVSWSAALFTSAYTLIPSVLFMPAYALWRIMERRPRPKVQAPLQLD